MYNFKFVQLLFLYNTNSLEPIKKLKQNNTFIGPQVMNDNQDSENEYFPISRLSELTQVNSVTLRAWERRYGLLKPQRTPKGHRLYCQQDVEKVNQIKLWLQRGISVGQVKPLLENQQEDSNTVDKDNASDTHWEQTLEQLYDLASSNSIASIESGLQQSLLNYPARIYCEELLQPLIEKLLHNNQQASFLLVQSILTDYVLMCIRKQTKKKNKSETKNFLLICANNTSIWRLTLATLQLLEFQHSVYLLNQPCDLQQAVKISQSKLNYECLFYQDNRWNKNDIALLKNQEGSLNSLSFCGAAPMLLEDKLTYPSFSSPQEAVNYYLKEG